jgi:hypothetical protein
MCGMGEGARGCDGGEGRSGFDPLLAFGFDWG